MKDFFINEPHTMVISGASNCGKTHFLLDLLETVYLGKFEYVILFCPTWEMNKTYLRSWVFKDKDFIVLNPTTVINNLDKTIEICIETFKGSNTLFIFDDCANLQDTSRKKTKLCELAFSGRHYNITTWVLVQKYNSVVKDVRENIRFLVLFYNKDENSMKDALAENSVIPKDKRYGITNYLKNNKNSKVLIRLDFPRDFKLFK